MRLATLACLALILLSAAFVDGEAPVQLDKLSKSVVQSVKTKYPKAKMLDAAKETVDSETFYIVTLKEDSQTFRAWFTTRGKLTETNRRLEIKDVSKYVELALRKNYPGAKLEEARERTIDPAKSNRRTVIVTLTTAANKKLEVIFDTRGSILEEKELKVKPKDDKAK